jgi:hypothetical protein
LLRIPATKATNGIWLSLNDGPETWELSNIHTPARRGKAGQKEKMRLHFWKPDKDFDINEIDDPCVYEIVKKEGQVNTGVREAKKLLKLYGGTAWTEHYERDGTMFEVTQIELTGNNSTHKYNHHL